MTSPFRSITVDPIPGLVEDHLTPAYDIGLPDPLSRVLASTIAVPRKTGWPLTPQTVPPYSTRAVILETEANRAAPFA